MHEVADPASSGRKRWNKNWGGFVFVLTTARTSKCDYIEDAPNFPGSSTVDGACPPCCSKHLQVNEELWEPFGVCLHSTPPTQNLY